MSRLLILLIMILAININNIIASYFGNVLNESVSDTLDIYHLVERKSDFNISFYRSTVDQGNTKIAKFNVRNNTIDGYKLLISSQNGGVLSPASSLDGETDISYTMSIDYSGDLGSGVTSTDTVSSIMMTSGQNTPLLTTTYQTSPTDVEGYITISIEDTNNQFNMAGNYSDTITITYEDN